MWKKHKKKHEHQESSWVRHVFLKISSYAIYYADCPMQVLYKIQAICLAIKPTTAFNVSPTSISNQKRFFRRAKITNTTLAAKLPEQQAH